jgi:hypothetical protein
VAKESLPGQGQFSSQGREHCFSHNQEVSQWLQLLPRVSKAARHLIMRLLLSNSSITSRKCSTMATT